MPPLGSFGERKEQNKILSPALHRIKTKGRKSQVSLGTCTLLVPLHNQTTLYTEKNLYLFTSGLKSYYHTPGCQKYQNKHLTACLKSKPGWNSQIKLPSYSNKFKRLHFYSNVESELDIHNEIRDSSAPEQCVLIIPILR